MKNRNITVKHVNEKIDEYQSAPVMLDYLQKEYEYDLNNLNSLYTRVGIIIAFTGIYLNMLFTYCQPLKGISNLNSDFYCLFKSITFTTNIISIICAIVALLLFFRVILLDKYKRLDHSCGFNKKAAILPYTEISFYLMEQYQELLLNNKPVLDKKFRLYKRAIILLIISILAFVISYLDKIL